MVWRSLGGQGKVERFVDSEDSTRRRLVISQVPRFNPNRTRLDGGELVIDHPFLNARGELTGIDLGGRAQQTFEVQEFIAGSWVALPKARGPWDAQGRKWTYGPLAVTFDAQGKWTYAFVAPHAGRFRLRTDISIPGGGGVRSFTRRGETRPYMAQWRGFRFNWRDIVADLDIIDLQATSCTLITNPVDLAAAEVWTLDPSVGPLSSSWGADVDTGAKYPDDGSSDWVGDATRTGNKFDITSLSASDTVTQVDCSVTVNDTDAAGSLSWYLGPYNGDGQADPESDSAATMFSRCDTSADKYLTTTVYRTTGTKTHTNLGSQANADVEAARDAGTIFSLAWRADSEGSGHTAFDEYTGANPPTLTITYTTGGGGGLPPGGVNARGAAGGLQINGGQVA